MQVRVDYYNANLVVCYTIVTMWYVSGGLQFVSIICGVIWLNV